MLIEKF